jgi:hypothetical protein
VRKQRNNIVHHSSSSFINNNKIILRASKPLLKLRLSHAFKAYQMRNVGQIGVSQKFGNKEARFFKRRSCMHAEVTAKVGTQVRPEGPRLWQFSVLLLG